MHAAREGSIGVALSPGEYAIALQTRADISLEDVSRRLIESGIRHRRIYESDPPYCGLFMSIGCVPCDREKVAKLLKDLPSAKETI